MNLSIPEGAMPVVLILRCDVPTPDPAQLAMVTISQDDVAPRFILDRLGIFPGYCPLGLHRDALYPAPARAVGFTLNSPLRALHHSTRVAFTNWRDSLTLDEAREAISLIWQEDINQCHT